MDSLCEEECSPLCRQCGWVLPSFETLRPLLTPRILVLSEAYRNRATSRGCSVLEYCKAKHWVARRYLLHHQERLPYLSGFAKYVQGLKVQRYQKKLKEVQLVCSYIMYTDQLSRPIVSNRSTRV